jgi:hypothetical protein
VRAYAETGADAVLAGSALVPSAEPSVTRQVPSPFPFWSCVHIVS